MDSIEMEVCGLWAHLWLASFTQCYFCSSPPCCGSSSIISTDVYYSAIQPYDNFFINSTFNANLDRSKFWAITNRATVIFCVLYLLVCVCVHFSVGYLPGSGTTSHQGYLHTYSFHTYWNSFSNYCTFPSAENCSGFMTLRFFN